MKNYNYIRILVDSFCITIHISNPVPLNLTEIRTVVSYVISPLFFLFILQTDIMGKPKFMSEIKSFTSMFLSTFMTLRLDGWV